ncbi:MAG: glycosyltransferase family 4 protein [bacterium]|nr:glycosyltransferase family 4 protein [bacterium]
MNLLFLNSIEVGTYGGMEDWIRLVASGLSKRGHSVTVSGRRNSEFLKRVSATSDSIRVESFDISGDFNPTTIASIKKYIKLHSIETVVVNFNKDLRLGGLAARWAGDVKVIWSLGLDITKDSLIHKTISPRLFDGVIVPSEALKKQIAASGYIQPDEVRVIPIGIPPATACSTRNKTREKLGVPSDAILAVTSGRFVAQKGHRYLIEAAPQIIKSAPQIRFLLLGDGFLQQEHEAAIEKLNLGDRFIFAGMLESVHDALVASDLMIHPSIEEPFGIVLLEAMRAGLPIVASRVGGIPDVVAEGENAELIPPMNPEALAESVVALIMDPSRMERYALAGQERWNRQFRDDLMVTAVENYLVSQRKAADEPG